MATLVAYLFNLVVMPAGMREMKDRVFEIRADLVNTFVREGSFTNPIDGLTVYVGENNVGGDIRGILVHDARNPKGIATYMAQRGLLANTPLGPRLIMFEGNIQWLEGGEGRLKILNFEKYTFDLGQFDKQRDETLARGERALFERAALPGKDGQRKTAAQVFLRSAQPFERSALLHGVRADRRRRARRRQLQPARIWRAHRVGDGGGVRGAIARVRHSSNVRMRTPDVAFLMYVWPRVVDRRIVVCVVAPRFEMLNRAAWLSQARGWRPMTLSWTLSRYLGTQFAISVAVVFGMCVTLGFVIDIVELLNRTAGQGRRAAVDDRGHGAAEAAQPHRKDDAVRGVVRRDLELRAHDAQPRTGHRARLRRFGLVVLGPRPGRVAA